MKVGDRISAKYLPDGSFREGEIIAEKDDPSYGMLYRVRFDGQYFIHAQPIDAGSDAGCFKSWYMAEELSLAENQSGCYWL